MSSTPLVSVITPNYNRAEYLPQCLASVRRQSFTNWEHILVDDGSDDHSVALAREQAKQDPRLRVVVLDRNRGVREARNTALELARGAYIAFLDSDDWWLSEKLAQQLRFMQDQDAAISATGYEICDEHGRLLNRRLPPARITYRRLLCVNEIGLSTGMYDSRRCGKLYNFHPHGDEDHPLWLELTREHGPAYGLRRALSFYRRHRSASSLNKLAAMRRRWQTYRHTERIGALGSAVLFGCYGAEALHWRLRGYCRHRGGRGP